MSDEFSVESVYAELLGRGQHARRHARLVRLDARGEHRADHRENLIWTEVCA